jgi:dienelactone hydrolase
VGIFAIAGLLLAAAAGAAGQPAGEGTTCDGAVPPGENYATAEFRLWLPPGAGSLKGTLVLVPGSNADGRAMADDPVWRDFGEKQRLGLLACHFTDHPHDQAFIENYVAAARGSGQALLDALAKLAGQTVHPELAAAPLLLWGESAGGEFNYEFAAWRPERVIAFVVNKGGIYYSALVSPAARAVPALLFVGEADLASRNAAITGLFALNRRAGARWALVREPGTAHAFAQSRKLALVFFAEVLPLRLEKNGPELRPLPEDSGWWGDLQSGSIQAAARDGPAEPSNAWLPTERTARAWQAVVSGKAGE